MPKEYVGMPEPPFVGQLKEKSNKSYIGRLSDAEISDVEELFNAHDKGAAGAISPEEFKTLLKELQQDAKNMGKVPKLAPEDIDTFVKQLIDTSEEANNTIPWNNVAKHLNDLEWTFIDPAEIQRRIDQYYAEVIFKLVIP